MNKFFYVKTALNYTDGVVRTNIRLFPRTIKQYPFFQGKTGLDSFRNSNRTIEMELDIAADDPYKEHEQRFADIHFVTEFSPAACYLIISQRFKNLLSDFKICEHRFDPINLHGLGEVRPYYLFHIPRPFGALDFEKSIFGIFNNNGPQNGFIELFQAGFIKNRNHLKTFEKEYLMKYDKSPEFYESLVSNRKHSVSRSISCRKAVFKESYDIIAPIKVFGILVNEKVKQAIESSNLVGWEFKSESYNDNVFFKIEIPEVPIS